MSTALNSSLEPVRTLAGPRIRLQQVEASRIPEHAYGVHVQDFELVEHEHERECFIFIIMPMYRAASPCIFTHSSVGWSVRRPFCRPHWTCSTI